MRRAQINSGSQPVRNQWPSPTFETGSGTGAVRTNLATHPNMTATTGAVTVRTNLCLNPRGVNAFSGYGTQTITPNVAISGHPDGITTAARVEYAGGAQNPGVAILNPSTSGVQYTMSAWVYHETIPSSGSQGFAEAGVTSMPSPPAFVQGVWQRFSWTYTGTGSFFGFRVSAAQQAGSFLITGIVVEVAGYLAPFFDGASPAAGDFTHAWSGTANASTSTQRSTNVAGWSIRWHGSTGGTGVMYQSTDTPYDGIFQRKLWKTANTGAAQDTGTGLTTRTPVTAGTTYTASIMARCSEAQRFSIFFDWHDAAGNALAGQRSGPTDLGAMSTSWARFSYTATAPAGAVSANIVFGPYSNALPMAAGATLDFDQCLIESNPALGVFFTGNFPASGDFTYNWTGTVNESTSEQRGVGLPGVTSGNSMAIQSSEWSASGSKSLRIVANTQFNTSSAIMLSGSQLERGKTYTAIATRRLTAPLTGTLSAYAGSIIFVHTSVGTYYSNFIVNSAGVGVAKLKFFLADNGTSWTLRLGHGGAAGSGDVWWDNFMVVEGDYEGDFINPAQNVLAKWDGTPNASTSVGYPPQLLDIAGKPLQDGTDVAMNTGYVVPAGPVTIYTVQNLQQSTGNPGYWEFSTNGAGFGGPNGIARLIGSLPTTGRLDQMRTNSTSINYTVNLDPLNFAVTATAIDSPTTATDFQANGGVIHSIPIDPLFRGNVGGTLKIGTRDSSLIGNVLTKRVLIYGSKHDAATRQAISRYLGNKYGVPVA